jgi:hypothetical protein
MSITIPLITATFLAIFSAFELSELSVISDRHAGKVLQIVVCSVLSALLFCAAI